MSKDDERTPHHPTKCQMLSHIIHYPRWHKVIGEDWRISEVESDDVRVQMQKICRSLSIPVGKGVNTSALMVSDDPDPDKK